MKTGQFLSYLYSLGITVVRQGERLKCRAPQGTLTPSLRAELTLRKAEILEFLSQVNGANDSDLLPILPTSRSEPLPLSFAQARLWFLDQLNPLNPFYNMPYALRLTGELDVSALQQSLNEIIRRHETLRTSFKIVDGQPTQLIADSCKLTLAVIDLQLLPKVERDKKARELAYQQAQQPFDLTLTPQMRVMLLRQAPTEHVLLLVMHHIISDGWSMGVFHRELAVLYDTFVTGKTSPLPELSIQYADFGVWQRTCLEQTSLKKQLQYWEEQLADLAVLQLPTDYPRPAEESFRGAVEILELSQNLKQALINLSQQHGVTLFMTMLSVFKVLLYRYTGQTDIAIGSPIANRNRSEIEPLIGFFANTLVLRTQIQDNLYFSELLNRVRKVTLGAYAHQDLPFERLVEVLQPERHLDSNPLFQVVFAVQNAPMEELQLPGLQLSRLEFEDNTTRFDLEWHVWEQPQGLQVTVSYATDLFAQETILRMLGHFQTLLDSVVANSQQQIWELPLLSATEHQLLMRWNDAHTEYPQDKCIHQLFEAQVERTPDAVAVVSADKQLTYRELNAQANQLAHHLQALKVGPEVVVGICMELSVEMIVGVLGILKAGGAYLPLDPQFPSERLRLMLRDNKASVVLTQQELLGIFALDKILTICLDTEWQVIAKHSQEIPISKATPESLMYVTYASKPGVLVEHQAVSQRLHWLQNTFVLSQTDVILHKAPLVQDTAVREIFWPLVVGGRLAISTENRQEETAYLQCLIAEQKVSIVNFAPSELSAFVAAGTESVVSLKNLRLVLCSGEPLHRSVVEAFKADFTSQLQYLYSLPEAAGELTSFASDLLGTQQTVPIGYPSYRAIYILDHHLQPVPVGVKGEIYVGGTAIARGYLKAEEEAAQRFVNNPLVKNPKARLFKTGELGRYFNDGTLEWLGSTNRQTWIKGYRVQLQSVEAALLALPSVEDARVLVRETEKNEPQLVAYVVLSGPFFAEQLQSELQNVLPAYELPCAYVSLSALPMTKTGVVDELGLSRLEVIDSDLVQKWEEQLRSLPEIEQVAVVVQEQTRNQPPVHLMDLLVNWKASAVNNSYEPEQNPVHPEVSENKLGLTTLAISNGGPLHQEADLPTTLAQALHRAAQHSPTKGIVYIQSNGSQISQSYGDLLESAQRILAGLRKLGLKPQDKVIFQLEQNQDFIPAFWGCVLGGFVPVPVAIASNYSPDNSATRKLENAWQMLGRPLVLTTANQQRAIYSWSKEVNLENFQVETIDQMRDCEPDLNWQPCQSDDMAVLMLTSGSTGIPKGVVLSHNNLLSRTMGSIQMNGFSREDVTLNWMPMDHVAGLIYFHIRDIYLGCQQIQVPTELVLLDPLRWLDWIDQHRVTITFAPNFAFGLVNDLASEISQRHWDLSCLKFVLNGAESIVAKTARQFLKLLAPNGLSSTAMHPAWGMAEISSGVTYANNFSLLSTKDNDSFVSVGAPIPGVKLRIVDSYNQVVSEDTIGSLQVSGNTVMSGYYHHEELNREVFTSDGWFKTGDLAFLHQGCLIITGREKDVIIINGANYYSHEIESAVEELCGVEVSFTAAVAVRFANDQTDKLAIFFSPVVSDWSKLVKLSGEIRSLVVQKIGINPNYLIPVEKSAIPKTSIGKIQRSQLRQRFEAGEFNDILKQLDINSANHNTLPDWFYRKVWCRKDSVTITPFTQLGQFLVFLDPLGVGEYLCTRLEQLHQPFVKIEVGAEFTQLAAHHYRLAPGNPNHYQLLFEFLALENIHITQILHLWNYHSYNELKSLEALEMAQEKGVYSLLFLVQALAKVQGSQHQVRLLVISSHTQAVSPQDAIAYEKATILGLLKTIPQEMPWLSCCHVDLPPSSNVQWNGERILNELRVLSKEKEVAYRDGHRWVCRLEKANLSVQPKQQLPFQQGGMYLLSGGLGGIGIEIASYLLQHYQAKLLLVGRTPLPERSTWDVYVQQSHAIADKIRAIKLLEQFGGEILYHAVDICDLTQMQVVVEQAQSHWQCQLHGVIHLAGTYHESKLIEETIDSVWATLAPKVLGSWVLHQLLQDKPYSIFINFSSVNGFFGGTNVGAYAAANSFLDSFAQYQKYNTSLQSYCLCWSMWDEIGMSRGYQMKELTRARGYYIITAQQGLYSLLASLHHDQAQLVVGLDGSNRNLRPSIQSECYGIEKLSAYYTIKNYDLSRGRFKELMVCDRFGTKSNSDFVQLEEMPLTNTGEIDREQLLSLGTFGREGSSRVEPRTEIERQLASIWQQVLNIPVLGIHDNFFELGGHSLLATQLMSRIQDVFELELPLRSLFENPTVAEMSSVIVQALSEKINDKILVQLMQLSDDQIKAMLVETEMT